MSVHGETPGHRGNRRKLDWAGPGKYLALAATFLWLPLAAESWAQEVVSEPAAREYQINQPGQRPAVVKGALPQSASPGARPTPEQAARPKPPPTIVRLGDGADETLVLNKTIEVQESGGVKYITEQYQVQSGDTLYRILRNRGLISQGRAAPGALAAVKDFNPEVKDLNSLSPGQILVLPTEATASGPEAASGRPAAPRGKPLGYYQIAQDGQKPAQVTVLETPVLSPDVSPANNDAQAMDALPVASRNPKGVEQTAEGVSYHTVTIKSGDTLERILRREGLSTDLIYRHMLKVTVDLNNDLKNPNLIVAGMELKIPVQGDYLAQYEAAPAAKRPGKARPAIKTARAPENKPAQARPSRDRNESARAAKAAPAKAAPAKAAPAKAPKKPVATATAGLPSARSEASKTALTMIFARLGENVNSAGQLFLPLSDGGQLDIDTTKFPVLELHNGRRIILDLDDRLPKAMVESLNKSYNHYTVLKAGKNESLSQTLDKLWAACNYFRVYKKGQTFEGGRQVVLTLEADWLVWPTSETWAKGQPIVINVVGDAKKTTPKVWLNFLAQNGIKVIDIHDKGNLVGQQAEAVGPVDGDLAERNINLVEVTDLKPAVLAGSLLDALGQEYASGVPLDVELPDSKGAGFSLKVAAPIVVTQNNRKTILDFGEMPYDVSKILQEQGYQVIVVSSDPAQVIKAVCDLKGIKLEPGLTIRNETGVGPKISLTVKGQSFKYQGREFLATNVDIPPVVAPLISDSPLVVIKYPTARG